MSLAGSVLGIEIHTSHDLRRVRELLGPLGDALNEDSAGGPIRGTIVLEEGAVDTAGTRELEAGVRIGRDVIVDSAYGTEVRIPDEGTIHFRGMAPLLEWIVWAMQLLALRAGAAFVHGAALEREGRAVLFPSWGGVGKTAIVADYIRTYGWRLLGDDLSLLDSNGVCYAFPKGMVLYPYHKAVFPNAFAAGMGPAAPSWLNSALGTAARHTRGLLRACGMLEFARRHNPQCRPVRPSALFSTEECAVSGVVDRAIWLERRVDIEDPFMEDAGGSIPGRIVGSTLNEYDKRCVRLTNIALGLGILDLQHYFRAWDDVLVRSLASKPQYLLAIPATVKINEVGDVVQRTIAAYAPAFQCG